MKQKHADSPSAFLAAAMAVTGAAMLLCPLIGQNAEMNRSAAEYDDLRVQLKSEEPAQATDAPENRSTLRQMFDAAGFPSTTQVPLELPEQDENPPEINIGTGADLAACLAQNDDFIAWIKIPGTNVDYPVVWTDDAEHYLHHTFTGKQGAAGTLFSLMKTDYSMEEIMPELAKQAGATEALKATNPMRWVGLMNTCKAQAEEIVMNELIYA